MNLQQLNPWNWFSHEEANKSSTIPVKRDNAKTNASSTANDNHPIAQLHRDIDRWFDDAFRNFGFPSLGSNWLDNSVLNSASFHAKLNVASDDKNYHISLEAPGLTEKDITIELNKGVLTIRGEKKEESETKERHYYRVERSYGNFQRLLTLPEDADQNSINASMKNGVLDITVARKALPASETKRIPIN
jgi:HSP20 family protein